MSRWIFCAKLHQVRADDPHVWRCWWNQCNLCKRRGRGWTPRVAFGCSFFRSQRKISVTCTGDHQQQIWVRHGPATSSPWRGKYAATYLWSSNALTSDDSVQYPWSKSGAVVWFVWACFFMDANIKRNSASHPDLRIMSILYVLSRCFSDLALSSEVEICWFCVLSRHCIKIHGGSNTTFVL